MNGLRRWQLTTPLFHEVLLTADARLSATDFTDDQVWGLRFGQGDAPAIEISTRYGGRVQQVSLVPVVTVDQHAIVQGQTYYQAPLLVQFAPNFWRIESAPLLQLQVAHEVYAFESHAIGGTVELHNTSDQPLTLRYEWLGHAQARQGDDPRLGIVTLANQGQALSLGLFPDLAAVAIVENGGSDLTSAAPRIGQTLTLAPNETQRLRWACAARATISQSHALAQAWLAKPWEAIAKSITLTQQELPDFDSGDEALDALLALAVNRLVQAFLRPYGAFPGPLLVGLRTPDYGYSRKRDGSDYIRAWNGQDAALISLVAPAIASIAPQWAQGLIDNLIAGQAADGSIDYKPSTHNARQGYLHPPILAHLTERIFAQTGDETWLKRTYPALLKFLARWATQDKDGDGLPEYQDERQLGVIALPSFGVGHAWAQGLDIATAESPDLLALFIRDLRALHRLAQHLKAPAPTTPDPDALWKGLQALWNGAAFTTQDRDSHLRAGGGIELLRDASGDGEHFISAALPEGTAQRVIVRIIGGASLIPDVSCTIDGRGAQGQAIREVLSKGDFVWSGRQGVATTSATFQAVDRIACQGLSRVYRLSASTPQFDRLDLRAFVPLILDELNDDQRQAMLKALTAKDGFWRALGLSMIPASDPAYAEAQAGVWLSWNALIGPHLPERRSGELLRLILEGLRDTLARHGHLGLFYQGDQAAPLGDPGHLLGHPPLDWLMQAIGVRIVDAHQVVVEPGFAWGKTISITQHGVSVRRSSKRVQIKFAGGHTVRLDVPFERQIVRDAKPKPRPKAASIEAPTPSEPPPGPAGQGRIIIPVERDE